MSLKNNYNHTQYACFIGYITQAIVNNFAPLLFLTFQSSFDISLDKITLLITMNFGFQLLVDIIASRYADRIGYRTMIVTAHIFAAAGLIGLAVLPALFPDPYIGLLAAVALYAVGGGITEVLLSPIVEACPNDKKEQAMSLLHSFYCWGQVSVVLLSTLFFFLAGINNWRILACLWAMVPLLNAWYFTKVPIIQLTEEAAGFSVKDLFKNKVFWFYFVIMICSGASEQSMSQWASAFAETGLKVSKTVGDLAGPCLFAVFMGVSRTFYGYWGERIKLKTFMFLSCILCMASYLLAVFAPHPLLGLAGCSLCGLSVGILWPGAFSLSAKAIPTGGTAMFALLALAGDIGCSAGPTLVGLISNLSGGQLKTGLLAAICFPLVLFVLLYRAQKTA